MQGVPRDAKELGGLSAVSLRSPQGFVDDEPLHVGEVEGVEGLQTRHRSRLGTWQMVLGDVVSVAQDDRTLYNVDQLPNVAWVGVRFENLGRPGRES